MDITMEMYCVSADGLSSRLKEEVWMCQRCFRILKAPVVRDYVPLTECSCESPTTIHIMKPMGIHCPIGYRGTLKFDHETRIIEGEL